MRKYFIATMVIMSLIGCSDNKNEFLISNDRVGGLQKDTPIQKLDSIFAKDSIVNSNLEGELRYASTERITIFNKEGKELLEITPKTNDKDEKVVESVFVLSELYTTDKGISLKSTFKEVKEKYPELDIEPSISSVIVTPKGQNFYFTFDKTALKTNSLGLSDAVTADDIDDTAKITRISVNF